MIRISLTETALQGINEGFWFYEDQEVGLGDYFESCMKADIDGLRVTAGIHRRIHRYNRLLSRVFPHSIYYTFTNDEVTVWAVVDNRRDPKWIHDHLSH